MGRTAYEAIAGSLTTATDHPFADILNAGRKVVFSRTLKTAEWANTTIAAGDTTEEIDKLRRGDLFPYLHRLDEEATKAGLRFVRYADDFVVTANRRWKVKRADQMVRELLTDIGLSLNEDKSGIRNLERDQVEFLGFSFYGRFLRPRRGAIKSFKDQIRYLTRRNRGVSLKAVIASIAPVIRGWGTYFRDGHIAHLYRELDSWVRMRLRSYVSKGRKQTWRLNTALPTALLLSRGLVTLVSLRERQLSIFG